MKERSSNKQMKFSNKYLYMLEDYTGYCLDAKNIAITKSVPDFETQLMIVKQKTDTILINLGPRLIMTKGWSDQKKSTRMALCESMIAVSSPVAGYAFGEGKFDLEKQLSITMSAYLKLKPNELASFATTLVGLVTPMLPALVNLGVTQASLNTITAARTAFLPYINKPTVSKTEIKSNSEMIDQLLTDAMHITTFQLDRYVLRFKQMGHTDYYNNYINRRELKHYGTRHAHASVDVMMGDSNAPVQNAVITVSDVTIQSKTDNNGHCTVSPVPPGMHSITVTANGFPNPVTTEAQLFIKGKPTYFTVNMNEFNVPAVKELKKEKATA